MNKIWPFTFNALLFAGFASLAPFQVLYFQSLGFSGAEIGVLTGITPLVALVGAPLWTSLADASRRHRLIMSLAMLGGIITVAAFPLFSAFGPVLFMAVALSAFNAPVSSFADSATMFMLKDKKDMYGRIRLGGTLGFGIAAPLAGVLVQNYGLRLAFWGCAAMWLLAAIVSQKFVHGRMKAGESTRRGFRSLLTSRRWRLFMLVAFAGGLAEVASNTYLFPYLKELGAAESTMGLALTIGTLSEIPVLFYGNRLLRRFGAYGLLMLAMVMTGVRFLLFAVSGAPGFVVALLLLGGLAFPAMWLAGVAYADENAPPGMGATAQGMFSAMVWGFGAAAGGLIGGPLLENLGGRGLYLVFGLAVLVTVGFAAVAQGRKPAATITTASVAARPDPDT